MEYWDAFTQRLRERLGPTAADKLLFGEVYDGNPATLGKYTWRADTPLSPPSSLRRGYDRQAGPTQWLFQEPPAESIEGVSPK